MCHIIDNLTLYFEVDLIKGGQYNSGSRKAGIE